MKSALAKLAGYMPRTDDLNYLKSEWDHHGRRMLCATLGVVMPLVYIHFPFSDMVQGAAVVYTARELVKMTCARVRGYELGYDVGGTPPKIL